MFTHPLEPLCVEVNISYDLDMSRFPGLDDPYQMYQPALVVATSEARQTWLAALEDCDNENEESSDLFSFIESCANEVFTQTSTSNEGLAAFQDLIDDVDNTSMTTTDSCEYLSFLSDSSSSEYCDVFNFEESVTPEEPESPCYDVSVCSHSNIEDLGCQKRKRETESNTCETSKRLKTPVTPWSCSYTDIWNAANSSSDESCEFDREC